MRVVIDTNVLISGFLWKGVSRKVLDAARSSQCRNVVSLFILKEFRDVLIKDFHFPPEKVQQMIVDMLSFSEMTKDASIRVDNLRDVKDAKIIACAVSGRCESVVTGDKDLLVLKNVRKIRILTPRDFLNQFE